MVNGWADEIIDEYTERHDDALDGQILAAIDEYQ